MRTYFDPSFIVAHYLSESRTGSPIHQDNDGDTAFRQVLLVTKVLIRGYHRFEPFVLGG